MFKEKSDLFRRRRISSVMKNDSRLEAETISNTSTQALSLHYILCGLSHLIVTTVNEANTRMFLFHK